MKIEDLWRQAKRWRLQRNASYGLNLMFGMGFVLLGIGFVSTRERVVLVPMWGGQTLTVESGFASTEYLERLAVFFAERVLNISPENQAWNRDKALSAVSPEFYGPYKAKWDEDILKLRTNMSSTTFDLVSAESKLQNQVIVTGFLITYTRGREISRVKTAYDIHFTSRGHTFLIDRFKKIEESPA